MLQPKQGQQDQDRRTTHVTAYAYKIPQEADMIGLFLSLIAVTMRSRLLGNAPIDAFILICMLCILIWYADLYAFYADLYVFYADLNSMGGCIHW